MLDGTGRCINVFTTGRDGIIFFPRREGTELFFFPTARAVYFCFHDGRRRRVFFRCRTGERTEEHTALGTKAAVLLVQVKVIRRA